MSATTAADRRPWLVTGAAGFLGSHVVEDLLGRGTPVVALDNLQWGRLDFLAPSLKNPDCTLVVADLRDPAGTRTLLERFRPAAVVHLAALHYIPACVADPALAVGINVLGTQSILSACRGRRGRAVLVRLDRRRLRPVRVAPPRGGIARAVQHLRALEVAGRAARRRSSRASSPRPTSRRPPLQPLRPPRDEPALPPRADQADPRPPRRDAPARQPLAEARPRPDRRGGPRRRRHDAGRPRRG